MNYQQFLEDKILTTVDAGFEISDADLHESNKPHQRDIIRWAAKGGKRAIFASFGLGKTQMQLELARLCIAREGGKALITCPLGVKHEFKEDADRLGIKVEYSRNTYEADRCEDRLFTPEEIRSLPLKSLQKRFYEYFKDHIYDFDAHVQAAIDLDGAGKLPTDFETLRVPARTENVWDDIVRMRTLNSQQSEHRERGHICPFQLDIVSRAIIRWSNPGDIILDPFGGLSTVGHEAIQLGRKAITIELNEDYWRCGARYCRDAETKMKTPTLFDLETITE